MRHTLVLSALVLAACGASPPPAGDKGPGPGAPDMAMMAGGGKDAATVENPETLRYDLLPFTLQPGEEKILCQYVPPDGKEHWISRFVTDMAAGSHHLVVFRIRDSKGLPASGPTDCINSDVPSGFDGMLPGSQQLHSDFTLPSGVAMKLEAQHGMVFQQHYINASNKVITTKVSYALTTIPVEQVKEKAGMLFYSNFGLKVPPGKTVLETECEAKKAMHLVMSTGHMHRRGTAFDTLAAGKTIYHTDNWDEPNQTDYPLPGYALNVGDKLSYACSYDNKTDKTFKFGNSAIDNEMCIMVAVYYPSSDGGTDLGFSTCKNLPPK